MSDPDPPAPDDPAAADDLAPVRLTGVLPISAILGHQDLRHGHAGELVRAGVTLLLVLAFAALVWVTRVVFLLAFLGMLLGLAASVAVDRLERWRIRRTVGAPLVVFGTLAIVLGVALASAPTVVGQVGELRARVPEALHRIDAWAHANGVERLLEAALPVAPDTVARAGADSVAVPTATGRIGRALAAQIGSVSGFAFGLVGSALQAAAALVLVTFLAIYIAMDRGTYRRGALLLVPPEIRPRYAAFADQLGRVLRRWLVTQVIAMLVIGVASTAVFLMLGVPAAVPLGILAGVFEFIPTLGPIMSAIPAVLMGLSVSPEQAVAVAVACWGIQFLENNLLIPYLMQEELDLPPALTLVTQAVMALLFGLPGIFVAVPLLAVAVVAVRILWVREERATVEPLRS
jgi:predicted PurR-regulated permease PerM